MGHGKQPLCQLRIQQLGGNPHFASNAKESPEEWVDAALVHDTERREKGPVKRDVSLGDRLEVLVQPVQYWVDKGVPKAERSGGEGTEDGGVNIGVITCVRPHYLHACLTKDLEEDKKMNVTVCELVIIFMITTIVWTSLVQPPFK